MYSAAGFWDGDGWRRRRFINNSGLRFLDCGGFTLLNRFGDYPFRKDAYLNLVAYLRPNYYASMDYPCEPEISRTMSLSTNSERIRVTVENSRWFADHHQMVGGDAVMVPVIQGYTLDEYRQCIDQHAQAGTLADYMAIGSMCRRLSDTELHTLIPGIAEYARQGGVERLHWFGLKLTKALSDLSEYVYSRDSAVVLDAYDTELRASRNGRRWPRGQDEKRQAFYSFLRRVEDLGLCHSQVPPT